MSRKPKSKLPAGWDLYSSANRKPIKPNRSAKWKFVPWVLVLGGLAGVALYPWQF